MNANNTSQTQCTEGLVGSRYLWVTLTAEEHVRWDCFSIGKLLSCFARLCGWHRHLRLPSAGQPETHCVNSHKNGHKSNHWLLDQHIIQTDQPFSDWLDARDGDLTVFRFLFLQSPGGEWWSSIIIPPWPKAVSWCERVVLVPEITMNGTNYTHANTQTHKRCLSQTYFGGPKAKPGSSNMSSLEREEDLAPTGVSCSITCISDITEWDTALQKIKDKVRWTLQ